jgi:hypothetical protein
MPDPDRDLDQLYGLYRDPPDSDAIAALAARGVADEVLAAAHGLEVATHKVRAALLGELDGRAPAPTGWTDYLAEKAGHAHRAAARLAHLLDPEAARG